MSIMRATVIASVLGLSACGVADVGTTAATTAKLQAEQAKQGQEAIAKIKTDLDAALKAEQQRNAATEVQQ
jgi:hypothetical protein